MKYGNGAASRALEQYANQGMQIIPVGCDDVTEYCVTARAALDDSFDALWARLAEALRDLGAQAASLEVFGFPGADVSALHSAFGDITFPVTWVEEGCNQASPLRGIQAWAVAGPRVEPVVMDGRIVGCVFDSDGVRFCRLGGLVPQDISKSRTDQAQAVFETMMNALDVAGMDFGHVLRTWFYNDAMLEWYDEFNAVRTAFFQELGVFDGLVPASTGIGGRNAAGAALTAGLVAAKADHIPIAAVEVASPMQCPATGYGSSFSRAVEVQTARHRRLFVSGTASIAFDGASVHIGDTEAQAALTMQVVQAILESRGMH
ncbi:MAG TPA: hypothetical protein ENN65_06050, partial [Candidatus Hydrogenedentes bacterium]|nr:hypothetical protein [Candidatus Hydrogenedentota bacterium]